MTKSKNKRATVKTRKPKILLWDIETLQNIVATWGLFKQTIPYTNVVKERSIICAAFKYLNEPASKVKVISISQRPKKFHKDPHDDEYVVRELHKVLSEADVLVAHNGDNFDLKYFNSRALNYGLPPLPPIHTVDTYKWAKRKFRLNSNRLDYIGKYLGIGEKIKVSGDLWLRVLDGDIAAVKEMERYNKQDVLLLEQVYKRLRPYMTTHPNVNLFSEEKIPMCPCCGSTKLQRRGYRTTRISKYIRYQCMDCGAWSSSGGAVELSTIR